MFGYNVYISSKSSLELTTHASSMEMKNIYKYKYVYRYIRAYYKMYSRDAFISNKDK